MLPPSFLRDNLVKVYFPEATVKSKLVNPNPFCSKLFCAWTFGSINRAPCPATDIGLFLGLVCFVFSLLNPEDLFPFMPEGDCDS